MIVDNQPRARHSLHALLAALQWSDGPTAESDGNQIELIDEASDSQTAIEKAESLPPDVVVMELHRHEPDGLAAIWTVRQRWPEVRIVVLTMYATERAAALEAGANVFLLKGCSTRELRAAFLPQDGAG